MENDPFAVWLRGRVDAKGLSVRNMAMRIGIKDPSLLALMKGRSKPRPATILRIAKEFDVDADELMEMVGYRTPHRKYTLLPGWSDEMREIALMPAGDQDALLELVRVARRMKDTGRIKGRLLPKTRGLVLKAVNDAGRITLEPRQVRSICSFI